MTTPQFAVPGQIIPGVNLGGEPLLPDPTLIAITGSRFSGTLPRSIVTLQAFAEFVDTLRILTAANILQYSIEAPTPETHAGLFVYDTSGTDLYIKQSDDSYTLFQTITEAQVNSLISDFVTAGRVIALISSATGDDRLSYNALKDVPGTSTGGATNFNQLQGQIDDPSQLPLPAVASLTTADGIMFIDANDNNKRKRILLTNFIDRVRSGMAEATSSTKGLMSASNFNRLAQAVTDIATLGSSLNTLNSSVTTIAGKVTALEGSVTVTDETAKRVAGDMLTSINVGNLVQLNSALTAQNTSDESLEIHFTAAVTKDGTTYPKDLIAFVAPRSQAIESRFVLPQPIDQVARNQLKTINNYLGDPTDITPYRVYQANGQPGILNVADLDGDYILVIKRPDDFITGPIVGNTGRIDELRIFITNGGISQRVHSVDPYTFDDASQVIPFNISDAEETAVVSRITGSMVEFRVSMYESNGAVGSRIDYSMPINPAFQAPPTVSSGVDQNARNAAAAAAAAAATADGKAVAAQGTANTAISNAATASQAAATADGKAVAAQGTADANKATIDKLAIFGQYTLTPAGLRAANPPDFMALTLSTKRVNKIIDRIQVNMGGVIMYDARRIAAPVPPATDPLASFNFASSNYQLSGGVLNLAFKNDADKRTFSNAAGGTVAMRDQFIEASVTYTFTDGTGQTDRMHFGVNNNAFRPGIYSIGARLTLSDEGELSADEQGGGGGSARAFGTSAGEINPVAEGNSTARWAINKVLTAAQQAVVNGVAFTSALRTKLTALPTRAELTTELNAKENTFTLDSEDLLFSGRELQLSNRVKTLLAELVGASAVLEDTDPTSPISASADTLDKLLYRGGFLYRTVPTHYAERTVAWRDFATSDLTGGLTWGGARQVSGSAARNTVIYSIPGVRFERRGTFGGTLVWGPYNVPNWIGPQGSEAEADAYATAVGQVAFFDGRVQVVTRITARTPDAYGFELYEHDINVRLAEVEARPKAFTPKGTFAVRTAYDVGDVVAFNNHLYYIAVAVPDTNTDNPVDGATYILLSADPTPTATTSRQGTVELATQAEMNAGSGNRIPDAHVAKTYIDAQSTAAAAARYTNAEKTAVAGLPSSFAAIADQALTYAAAVTWNVNSGHTAAVTLTGNIALNMSGGAANDTALLIVTQDGTGSRTLALHSSVSRFAGISAPVLKTAANAVDILFFANIGGTWTYLGMLNPPGIKTQMVANEAAYNAITTKDANTIYWWP